MASMLQKSFPALTHVDLEWGIHDFPESESKLPSSRSITLRVGALEESRVLWLGDVEEEARGVRGRKPSKVLLGGRIQAARVLLLGCDSIRQKGG